MHIGDTKSFKQAIVVFSLVGFVLLSVYFGSYYLGRYGFSLTPFAHTQDGLWWVLYEDACQSASGAFAAATCVYINNIRMRDKK
jgi:hypothetical protein